MPGLCGYPDECRTDWWKVTYIVHVASLQTVSSHVQMLPFHPSSQTLAALLMYLVTKTARQGAQPAIYCAVSETMEGVSGRFIGDFREERLMSAAAVDDEAAERLWQVSAQLVGLAPSEG